MEVMSSPYKNAPDSPSRQLLYELNQLSISAQEGFYAQLDREAEERDSLHKKALAAAAEQHERVRKSVELERQRLDARIQAERDKRDAEARRELDQRRKEKVEREIEEQRREVERAKAIEAEQKKLAEIKRSEREEKEARKARREQENAVAINKAREQEDATKQSPDPAQARSQLALETAQTKVSLNHESMSSTVVSTVQPKVQPVTTLSEQTAHDPRVETEHNRYLEIHRRLKDFRKFMTAQAKEDKQLKTAMGDMRREITKCVGQLTEGKGANRQPLSSILHVLKRAISFRGPSIDVTQFLAYPPPTITDTNGPALIVYLLNIFSKAIISQYIGEASVSPKAADPVGIIASHIFAQPDFKWNGISLIDILLAKYHAVCPVLFGIYGPESTERGKQRLGWWREDSGGPFILQQRHHERMTGLAAGFAALSLRNYEKSRLTNPFPDYHYWQAMAGIANVPSAELTQTHFVVLKGMIENYETKFIGFYGGAAVAALRHVLVELPTRASAGVASKSLAGLVDVLKKDKKLTL
ncbi:MAG: hypothetical protein Q9163_003069 [Psora crenata]